MAGERFRANHWRIKITYENDEMGKAKKGITQKREKKMVTETDNNTSLQEMNSDVTTLERKL